MRQFLWLAVTIRDFATLKGCYNGFSFNHEILELPLRKSQNPICIATYTVSKSFMTTVLILFATTANAQAQKAGPNSPTKAVVYKTPTCGCCTAWEEHLRKNGFQIESRLETDLSKIKKENSVSPKLASCHTAIIEGYVVEGHVPADAVRKLLKEKPKIKGLAVPGMPMGSPGMEGAYKERYNVISFDEKGTEKVFMEF